MDNISLRIFVNGNSPAECNRLSAELQQWLSTRVDEISINRVKVDMETQDGGTLLVAVLAAPAVVELVKGPVLELAKGIADWLRKRGGTVNIGADGSVTAENVNADSVQRIIVDVLSARHKG